MQLEYGERERELRRAGFTRATVVFKPEAHAWPLSADRKQSEVDGFAKRRGADIDVGDPDLNGGDLGLAPAGKRPAHPLYTTYNRSDIARIEWHEREDEPL